MDSPLLIVSNRGPLRFLTGEDGERVVRRGGGGLVTALSALTGTRPLTWVASAFSDEDAEIAGEGTYHDGNLSLRLVVHDREEYDRYYNVFANPTLWFIHHYLWALALEPSVDRNVRLAWEAGYVPGQRPLRRRGGRGAARPSRRPAGGDDPRLPAVHGPPGGARARAGCADPALHAHPLATAGLLAGAAGLDPLGDPRVAAGGGRRRAAHRPLRPLVPATASRSSPTPTSTSGRRRVHFRGRTDQGAVVPDLGRPGRVRAAGRDARGGAAEERVLEARPEKLLLRVDRTDPSKNVVRGFQAFDLFLSDHPEWGAG